MLQFLKTAKRNIIRNKIYAAINFTGLSIGIALTLLIFIYVREEVSYDKFHKNYERIYRIKYSLPSQGLELATSPPPIAPKLKDYFSSVELAARAFGRNVSIKRDDKPEEVFEETNVFFVDSTFNKIFSLDFVSGNPTNALRENQVIITEEMANKYFGDENPLGKSLNFSDRVSYPIAGVVKAFPSNSHLEFNMLLNYDNMFDMEAEATASVMKRNLANNFMISHSYTYVLLKEGAGPEEFDNGMKQFLEDNSSSNMRLGQIFTLMPLSEIHLGSELLAEPTQTNSWSNINIFIAVSVLTLLLAAINYINLATAQSFSRIKEIGIRKALGSGKSQLISQFLSEAFIFVLISFVFSFILIYLALPTLNLLTGKEFLFKEVIDGQLFLVTALVMIIITFLAGTYPAFFVTGFNTVNALKGKKIQATGNGSFLRKSLVVFQLTVASFLLVGSILIYNQLSFISKKSLGFDKDQIVMVQLFSQNLNNIFSRQDSTFQMRLETFSNQLNDLANVKSTSRVSTQVGSGTVYRGAVPEGFTADDNMIMANISADHDFLNTFGLEIIAGRTFNKNSISDGQGAYLVNETAVKDYGWGDPDEAIGKELSLDGASGTVIGVIKDFHFVGLTQPLSPLSINLSARATPLLAVKIIGDDTESVISVMEKSWNEIFPEKTFEYTLLDEGLARQYANYTNFGEIIKYFSILSIIISCLGLYGMILHTTENKMKAIGIRKVLGANISSLLISMFKEFSYLIIIAFTMAIPISYYTAQNWLNEFEYRIDIEPFVYIVGLLIIVVIVSITIIYQAGKAALVNPIKILKTE